MDLKRTKTEIVAMMRKMRIEEEFGLPMASRLALAVPLADAIAASYIRPEATEEEFAALATDTDEKILAALNGTIFVAFHAANSCKAMDCRKRLAEIIALLWLAGAEFDVIRFEIKALEFDYYGKPQFVKAAEAVGLPWTGMDNDEWMMVADDPEPKTASEVLG